MPTKSSKSPAVIQPPIEVALNRLVTTTSTSLDFKEEPTFDEWKHILAFKLAMRDSCQWWIGDLLNFGERKYGEAYAQAIEITGNEYKTLANAASVCARFEFSRRRENLSYGHHEAVAYIDHRDGDRLLIQAERENWTRQDLRDAVSRLNGTPTKAERDAARASKPANVTKTKTTNVGKPPGPPTIDVQAKVTPQPSKPAATPEPPSAPKPAPPVEESPMVAAARHIEALAVLIPQIDWAALKPLEKKTWLKRLIPIDELIDLLTK